jgi:hypothetical protein
MEDTSSLRRILKDLSIALAEDNEFRDIKFRYDDELGAYTEDGDVTINADHEGILDTDLNEKEEFGLIVGTESHELEHAVSTNPEAIRRFSEEYEDKRPRLAGYVFNVVEDVYIDNKRIERDPGLRPIQNRFIEILRENHDPITEIEPPHKHATAVLQIGKMGGTPVGFEDVKDKEFKDFCAKVRILLDEARSTYIQSERVELSHDIMDLMEEYAGSLDVPELDLPPFMTAMPEKEGDGGPLPEPAENSEEQDGEFDMPENPAEMQDMSPESGNQGNNDNSGRTSNPTIPDCTECGSENTDVEQETVSGMVAARCSIPFAMDADWVANVNFVEDNTEDGLCGFRVNVNGDVPRRKIESYGYKAEKVSGGQIEVLEPKERYDDKEPVKVYYCLDCGHSWLPGLGAEQ